MQKIYAAVIKQNPLAISADVPESHGLPAPAGLMDPVASSQAVPHSRHSLGVVPCGREQQQALSDLAVRLTQRPFLRSSRRQQGVGIRVGCDCTGDGCCQCFHC